MISTIENSDWTELVAILREVEEKALSPQNKGNGASHSFEPSLQALESFQSRASQLGVTELQDAGRLLQRYAQEQIDGGPDAEALSVFSFAVNALLEQMERVRTGKEPFSIHVDEVMDILGVSVPCEISGSISDDDIPADDIPGLDLREEETLQDSPLSNTSPPDEMMSSMAVERLEMTVQQLGGQVSVTSGENGLPRIILSFDASPLVIEQIETLLSVGVPQTLFAPKLTQTGSRFDRVLGTIKEFMMALSTGNCSSAQDILLNLAEQQQQAGLYNEIGGLARDLHNSLKNFMETMDPHLREMVEEKIPDTGNRLEHILELTENAANTTIDHVEAIQRRNELEQNRLDELERIISKLTAIGELAQASVLHGQEIIKELRDSVQQNHEDLFTVLTAQDYQDLTGQIILKIIQLLNDLEMKLVNVIRTFGVKTEEKKEHHAEEELYGPAHKAMSEALHSQDDVDSLLAEFGF